MSFLFGNLLLILGVIGAYLSRIYDEVCKKEHLIEGAERMANFYASKSALPAQMIKKSVNAITYNSDLAAMHMDYDQFLLTREK